MDQKEEIQLSGMLRPREESEDSSNTAVASPARGLELTDSKRSPKDWSGINFRSSPKSHQHESWGNCKLQKGNYGDFMEVTDSEQYNDSVFKNAGKDRKRKHEEQSKDFVLSTRRGEPTTPPPIDETKIVLKKRKKDGTIVE
jgi:hypothetical protein